MRRAITYFFILVLFLSCQKQEPAIDGFYSEGGLISFSTRVLTKAPIIESLNGQEFGVYGYSFSNLTNWAAAKTKATPDVFYNLNVDVATDGSCQYDLITNNFDDQNNPIADLKEWEINSRYSFFAYFPYDGGLSSIELSASNVANDPYLQYTLPISSNNPDDLLDIMTAKRTDYNPASLGTVVGFEFNHRLFCIDILGKNFTDQNISIKNLAITISGIHYTQTKIYLDKDLPSVPNPRDTKASATYNLISNNDAIDVPPGGDAVRISNQKNVILIPQNSTEEPLHIKLSFNKVVNGNSAGTITLESDFNIDFKEGKKYSLDVNFLGSNSVTMVAAESAEWTAKEVWHTFD